MLMNVRLLIFFAFFGLVGCTAEFIPEDSNTDEENAFLLPTGDGNGQKGDLEATFLSSQRKYTTSSSTLSTSTFRVSFVTTAQNFDVYKWAFEGGTVSTTMASSTHVSGTTFVEGTLDDLNANTEIGLLVNYNDGFGRYDVTHAVANADQVDINFQRDYVAYEYLDDLEVMQDDLETVTGTQDIGWENPDRGWFGPQSNGDITYARCENSIIGFYQSYTGVEDQELRLMKSFRNFGSQPKNLVFEYKIDFLVQPPSNDAFTKIALSYAPLISQPDDGEIEIESADLWEENGNDLNDFRQVIIPLPLIRDFQLTFTKYPSAMNQNGQQRYPFIVCIRDIRIIPRGVGN